VRSFYNADVPLPERQLIERITRSVCGRTNRALIAGIGDDCAVLHLPPKHEALVTTDFSLEGIHFRREWHPADSVGHRCLARGLSDIAAMGGVPLAAFLSLALPADLPQTWVDSFLSGFKRLAQKFAVPLAGGDTAQSPAGVLADIAVLGSTPHGKTILRSGARIGDDIYVSGRLGGSVAVLRRLIKKATPGRGANYQRHFYPLPRIEIGQYLREHRLATAMIDLSDGLSTDLNHICEESGVGAWIAEEGVPVAPGATLEDALNGGEDYELLFTSPPARNRQIPNEIGGVPITFIGTITPGRKVLLVNNDLEKRTLKPAGWEHFRGSAQFPVKTARKGWSR
jgi:thiamine-monophosphate kinase